MSAHTPGPWFYWGSSGADITIIATIPKPKHADFDLDHEVLGVSEWVRLEQADARLIAAAPDLLAELRALASAAAKLEGVEIPYPIAIPLGTALLLAGNAIAKAEGR